MKRQAWIALLAIGIVSCAYISEEEWSNRIDLDQDGLTAFDDCAPEDPREEVSNKVPFYRDDDEDGFGRSADPNAGVGEDLSYGCPGALLVGWSELDGDCDDEDPAIHPDATEIWYNDVDENCDGNLDDQDGDELPGGENGSDCVDTDPSIDHNSCRLQKMAMHENVACGFWGTGELLCWGDESADAYFDAYSTAPGEFTSVAVGVDTTCVVTADGAIECWTGSSALSQYVPTKSPDDSPFSAISVQGKSACAMTQNGSLYCWSDGGEDTRYPKTLEAFKQIDQGEDCACALSKQGTATCWSTDSLACADGPNGNPSFVSLSVGKGSACALNPSGEVECWGDASFLDTFAPSKQGFKALSVGGESACALDANGLASCWSNIDQNMTPTVAFDWIKVESDCACGRKSEDQEVECWGACSGDITAIPTWSN